MKLACTQKSHQGNGLYVGQHGSALKMKMTDDNEEVKQDNEDGSDEDNKGEGGDDEDQVVGEEAIMGRDRDTVPFPFANLRGVSCASIAYSHQEKISSHKRQ